MYLFKVNFSNCTYIFIVRIVHEITELGICPGRDVYKWVCIKVLLVCLYHSLLFYSTSTQLSPAGQVPNIDSLRKAIKVSV